MGTKIRNAAKQKPPYISSMLKPPKSVKNPGSFPAVASRREANNGNQDEKGWLVEESLSVHNQDTFVFHICLSFGKLILLSYHTYSDKHHYKWIFLQKNRGKSYRILKKKKRCRT